MPVRLVVITDCSDVASNEIRAKIVSYLDRVNSDVVVEPIVHSAPFSLVNAAFMLRLMAESYNPDNTVFLIIANALPTARKDRARLVGSTKNGFKFVSENTGVLDWLLKDFGINEIYEYSTEGLDGKDFVSFGGKYFHAPKAAKIASGKSISEDAVVFDQSRLAECKLEDGIIVHIDNFGVAKIKTSFCCNDDSKRFQVFVNKKPVLEVRFTYAMKNLPNDTWCIYKGSSFGLMEIGCVRNIDAYQKFFKLGDIVTIEEIS